MHSNSGNIIAEKRFLGPSLDVTTDTGDIRITGSYADTVYLRFVVLVSNLSRFFVIV